MDKEQQDKKVLVVGEESSPRVGLSVSVSDEESDDEFHDCQSDDKTEEGAMGVDKTLSEDKFNINLNDVVEEARRVELREGEDVDAMIQQLKDAENEGKDAEEDDFEESKNEVPDYMLDDFVDEDFLKETETVLTPEQLEERFKNAKELKDQGNKDYQEERLEDSIKSYTKALLVCPLKEKEFRSILYGNRAAAKIKYGAKENAVMDCTKSLEYNENYMKSLIRRAKLYEEMDKLDEAFGDFKKIYELDPSNREAFIATQRLPPIITERNEKLKDEMMGKLKDLGNLVLRPFGLSTENFKLQPTESGGYTVNFKQ